MLVLSIPIWYHRWRWRLCDLLVGARASLCPLITAGRTAASAVAVTSSRSRARSTLSSDDRPAVKGPRPGFPPRRSDGTAAGQMARRNPLRIGVSHERTEPAGIVPTGSMGGARIVSRARRTLLRDACRQPGPIVRRIRIGGRRPEGIGGAVRAGKVGDGAADLRGQLQGDHASGAAVLGE